MIWKQTIHSKSQLHSKIVSQCPQTWKSRLVIRSFNLSSYTFFSKNIFHFQLNSEGEILVLLKPVHALPLIFTETDFYSYFFLLCWGLHRRHWNGLSGFATAQHSKRGAIRVRDSEDEKVSAWSAWPPSNFIQFHVLSWKHLAVMRQQVCCDCHLQCSVFHCYFVFLSFISSSHLCVLLCAVQSLWGRDLLGVLVYPTPRPAVPVPAEPLCDAPTESLRITAASWEMPQRPHWVTRFSFLFISAFYAFLALTST